MTREHLPDVILLDVEMPRLDGHGVLAVLRETPELADIPVVFLTGRTSTEDVVEALRLGAHDYLRKPFESAELLARVSAAFRVKVLQDQLRQRNNELSSLSCVNDTRGHDGGDIVLRAVAARLGVHQPTGGLTTTGGPRRCLLRQR